jgi:hypothetical protein
MSTTGSRSWRPLIVAWAIALLLLLGGALVVSAHDDGTVHPEPYNLSAIAPVAEPAGAAAACAGGPVIDGLLLDECVDRTFAVGGANKTVRVWYTKVVSATTRIEDGTTYNLQHWITSDAQAQQVAAWFEEAWLRFFADSGHHLYDNGCSRLNVRMEDGIGWSGIAYWGSPGNCWIGIDSPNVRNGGGQWTVYHEAQHYLQYSYDDGCYGYLQPNYPADSEFIEGYADLGADSVNNTLDASGYSGAGYDPSTSMYDKSYGNIFNKYFVEQLGTIGTPADAWHHMDALYRHYEACDDADTLYVLNTFIPTLKPGTSERRFFLDFFAANWAKDWADPVTQPELVYTDDDSSPYGTLAPTTQNVNMGSGSQSWSDTTPDDWAARYYQVTPQAGCPYLQVEVDGAAGAQLGINLMAAKISAPTSVLRSAVIGDDYVRTFAAAGVHNRVVAVVNSFANNYGYTVNFTCVNPTINILEPRQVQFALVGDPSSPIAFLARWEVTDGGNSVRGLPASAFTFEAEGDPITIVPGSFQEVGDDYWAVLLPPAKPAGTTFVDFRVNLGAINDTELDALLYVAPGNSDIALSFDASSSMSTEDAIGEGTRLANAQKAGQVIADLLRAGDRLLVQDWSAFDNPPGCGAPGDGNCPLDIRTLLPLSDATAGNLSTLIGIARTQIQNITAREWTPVGGGLKAAKDALLAAPANTNPKHIFLLSDGQENVKPFYADVKDEIQDAGVVVNTIAFGPEAPGDLMAQIAADTGGIYRPVATNGIGSSLAAAEVAANAAADAGMAAAAANSIEGGAEIAAALAAVPAPGQLGLANAYDYFDTEAQGAARVLNAIYSDVPAWDLPNSAKLMNINVDKSVNQLRLVVAGQQPDDENIGCTVSDVRKVDVLMPGMDPQQDRWIEISPPRQGVTPADWDIRNNRFDDVLVVNDPEPGLWRFRTYYYPVTCIPLASEAGAEQAAPEQQTAEQPAGTDAVLNGGPYDFMMSVSVQSTIQLEGRLLGLSNGQGEAGDTVDIVGMLLDKNGLLPAVGMLAQVEGPGGTTTHMMYDDGASHDGEAGDGIYGAQYSQTNYGGGYGVRIIAVLKDPANSAANLSREWNGGFWIKGPKPQQECGGPGDADKDCMPDEWERRCKLNLQADDRGEDPDHDGLTNIAELNRGTLPCRADTDKGGESDGSEVRYGRDPLNGRDDKVLTLGHVDIRAINAGILVRWTRPLSYTDMLIYVTPDLNNLGQPISGGQGNTGRPGEYLVDKLNNDTTYWVIIQPVAVDDKGNTVRGDLSEPAAATPKADPDMPSGVMVIAGDAPATNSRQVTLDISATDRVLDGAAQGSAAHMTDQWSQMLNVVSGNIQMRLSNSPDMAGAQWQPVAQKVPWTLACAEGQQCIVYAQFKDAAGNESLIVNDSILFDENASGPTINLFLPSIMK